MTEAEAEKLYREAEMAMLANPTDETMQAMTDAEQRWIDIGEIEAGGRPGGWRLEWSI